MIHRLADPGRVAPLFGNWPEGIPAACLQGVMGTVYGDDPAAPRSAAAVLGDFCFLAGEPLPELAEQALCDREFRMLIPQDDGWSAVIAGTFGSRAVPITRYATRKDTVFDRGQLETWASGLGKVYTICKINKELYKLCFNMAWSRDLVGQFSDWEHFRQEGLGFVVLANGQIMAGAASYARYREGIEIEIDTRPDFRRRGLARACGARLILACLDRGLYPSWDAHTAVSLALAEQLGYRLDRPYRAFAVAQDP